MRHDRTAAARLRAQSAALAERADRVATSAPDAGPEPAPELLLQVQLAAVTALRAAAGDLAELAELADVVDGQSGRS